MGLPSLAIYVHELLDAYRVRTLIRIGTCGGLSETLELRSLVISQAAGSDSASTASFSRRSNMRPVPTSPCCALPRTAAGSGVAHFVAHTVSSDVFYHPDGW